MKKFVIWLLLYAIILSACSRLSTKSSSELDQSSPSVDNFFVSSAIINGHVFTSAGGITPVQLTITVESVLEGEAAYGHLLMNNSQVLPPPEGKEYVVIGVRITYDDGTPEELEIYEEKNATLFDAKIYFTVPNPDSNSDEVTSLVSNPIWGQTVLKGESIYGEVAFIQDIGNDQPMYFVGYGSSAQFPIH